MPSLHRVASHVEEMDLRGFNLSWEWGEEQRKGDMLSQLYHPLFDIAIRESKYIPTEAAAD